MTEFLEHRTLETTVGQAAALFAQHGLSHDQHITITIESDDANEPQDWLDYARQQAAIGFAQLDRGEGIRGTAKELMAMIDAELAQDEAL